MASIASTLQRLKDDWQPFPPEEEIRAACQEAGRSGKAKARTIAQPKAKPSGGMATSVCAAGSRPANSSSVWASTIKSCNSLSQGENHRVIYGALGGGDALCGVEDNVADAPDKKPDCGKCKEGVGCRQTGSPSY